MFHHHLEAKCMGAGGGRADALGVCSGMVSAGPIVTICGNVQEREQLLQ